MIEHTRPALKSSADIVRWMEADLVAGHLAPGDRLPSVRKLATDLGLSPMTIQSAYRTLKARGLVVTDGRKGTKVAARPPLSTPTPGPLPLGVRNLADGNPNPELLPRLDEALASMRISHGLYGAATKNERLLDLMTEALRADGIPADHLAVTGGALDGIERVLQAHLKTGDRVAVEDPGYPPVFDLLRALGLTLVPMQLDDRGPTPRSLRAALEAGTRAVILTPRAQNPTGATFDDDRAASLRAVLEPHAGVLVIEDDFVGAVSGTSAKSLIGGWKGPWAVIRSFSKTLGPDLRIAVLSGDPVTTARVEGRQRLGTGWVSHILQQLSVQLLTSTTTHRLVDRAAEQYASSRNALVDALASEGIATHGHAGLNIWVPVDHEAHVMTGLLARGWAVSPGERFRLHAPPAIRITITTLSVGEAEQLATDFAASLATGSRSHVA